MRPKTANGRSTQMSKSSKFTQQPKFKDLSIRTSFNNPLSKTMTRNHMGLGTATAGSKENLTKFSHGGVTKYSKQLLN
jgi:hypothetical protein